MDFLPGMTRLVDLFATVVNHHFLAFVSDSGPLRFYGGCLSDTLDYLFLTVALVFEGFGQLLV